MEHKFVNGGKVMDDRREAQEETDLSEHSLMARFIEIFSTMVYEHKESNHSMASVLNRLSGYCEHGEASRPSPDGTGKVAQKVYMDELMTLADKYQKELKRQEVLFRELRKIVG